MHGCLFATIVKYCNFACIVKLIWLKPLGTTISYGKNKIISQTSFLPDSQALTWKAKEASYSHACQVATAGMESGEWLVGPVCSGVQVQKLGRDVRGESWLGNEGKRPASVDKEHPVSVNLCRML